MTKPPAYQHYAQDWLVGTAHLSLEAQGAYLRLLDHQWVDGPLSTDHRVLARLLGLPLHHFRRLWKVLGAHFPETVNGLCNVRLEKVRATRDEYVAAQRERGKAGAKARWGLTHQTPIASGIADGMASAMPTAMPTPSPENSSSSSSSSKSSSVLRTGAAPRDDVSTPRGKAADRPWNTLAADYIRKHCYPPNGQPPAGHDISRDIAWWKEKLDAGDAPEKIIGALRGAPLVAPDMLRGKKWSPAKLFSKVGSWVDFYDRAFMADNKSHRPRPMSEILGMKP